MQTGALGDNCWQESFSILSRWTSSFNSKEVMSHSEWGEKFPPFKEGPRCKQEHLATTVGKKAIKFCQDGRVLIPRKLCHTVSGGKSSLLLKKASDANRSTWRQLLARKLSNFVKMEEF